MSAANADTLLWQSRARIIVVTAIVFAWLAFRFRGVNSTEGSIGYTLLDPVLGLYIALGAVLVYLSATAGVYFLAKRRRHASSVLVLTALAMDIVMLFVATVLTTPVPHFERALLISLFVLQFALLYRGMFTAVVTAVAISGMYVLLLFLASRMGHELQWNQELWTLLLFLAAVIGLLALQGNASRRLDRIVYLFERMEAGDFSGYYDETADRQPDNVTYVGRAYNRMRVQLAQIVQTDSLSGCLNRRGFEMEYSSFLARAARGREQRALIALDLDYFKQVNDSFGHLAGDSVIQQLGELLRAGARSGDVVGRLGGEEFAIILPGTDEEGAVQLANRLLETIRTTRFRGLKRNHTLTASAGVVADVITSEDMSEELRARADEALYAAKRSGRNRVVSWSEGMRARTGEWSVAVN